MVDKMTFQFNLENTLGLTDIAPTSIGKEIQRKLTSHNDS